MKRRSLGHLITLFMRDLCRLMVLLMADLLCKSWIIFQMLVALIVLESLLLLRRMVSGKRGRVELLMTYPSVHAFVHELFVKNVLSMFDLFFALESVAAFDRMHIVIMNGLGYQ